MRYIVAGDEPAGRIGHAVFMTAPEPPAPREPGGQYRICVVCLGNICRSPMAEVVLRQELEDAGLAGKVAVESAGTGDWHVGDAMDRRARAELVRRGYSGSGHEARQIQPSWLGDFDLLLAMDRDNLEALRSMAGGEPGRTGRIVLMRSFDPRADDAAEVPDPYYGGPDDYAVVFELVRGAAQGLVARLAGLLS
jgi:protein-tyrosine phosphatase